MNNDEVLTDEEVTLVWEDRMGFPPRAADLAIIQQMGGTIAQFAEYVWDHWMGEPEEVTPDDLAKEIIEVLTEAQSGS